MKLPRNCQGDAFQFEGHTFTLESVIGFGGTTERWLARVDYGTLFVVDITDGKITIIN